MHMAAIALYSSSPPAAVWSTQCTLSSSSTAHFDVDSYGRPAYHHHSSARSVVGGLSGLFASSKSPQSPAQLIDGLESSLSCSAGMVRSSSQENLSYNGGVWDCSDSRGGSLSLPIASTFRLRERSPVSVLHGPASRNSHQNVSKCSLMAWDSAVSSSGLPPLDPNLDRPSLRRGVFLGDERRPISRSVGFEVGSDGNLVGCQARLLSADSSATCSNSTSPEDEVGNLDRYFSTDDGFLRAALPAEGLLSGVKDEPRELQEARRRLTKLAQGASGASSTSWATKWHLSADDLLLDAQQRHPIFLDALVLKAFGVAEAAHRGQRRRSGGLYLEHCVETAVLLANTGADSTVVAAGLLHDTLDDSTLDHEQLCALMGAEIEYLISGVSKLSTFSQLARDNETAGNPEEADRLRTMFLAMVDARVVLIKLADRLHNLRTLDALPAAKQLRIAEETLEIFAPLANRLGIWSWKAEMEDICFKHLKPQEYEELASKMAQGWQEGVVLSSIQQLDGALRMEGVEFSDICGRPKNLYSIYAKMLRKGRSMDEIFDVRGLRLIVKDTESCYAALNVVHRLWPHSPKKLKDYIADPKTNGYQSLHTVVWGEDGRPLEVQIRTMDMHHQAEYGMAAHWRYKENNSKHSSFLLQKVEWARWVLTWHSEILDTKLRVSPLQADLRPPCPFPFHKDDCPYADVCSLPPQNEDDPLFVIMVKNDNMIVQELAPGSTAADLLAKSVSDLDSVYASGQGSPLKGMRPKVNHQVVENFDQKLRMGDLVELTVEPELTPVMVPLSNRQLELTQAQIDSLTPKPCGKIALEFQREQLKRLYHDGVHEGNSRRGQTPREKNASVARLS